MKEWDGTERRILSSNQCMAHSAIEQALDTLEEIKPVPYNAFKWAIGIVIMSMLALFVVPITQMSKNKEILHKIHIEQTKEAGAINALSSKLNTWIDVQDHRIDSIEVELDNRHKTMEGLLRDRHSH